MVVTDWRMLGDLRTARDCRRIQAAIAKVEKDMATVKEHDRSAYLRLGLLHARLMRTLGRKRRDRR